MNYMSEWVSRGFPSLTPWVVSQQKKTPFEELRSFRKSSKHLALGGDIILVKCTANRLWPALVRGSLKLLAMPLRTGAAQPCPSLANLSTSSFSFLQAPHFQERRAPKGGWSSLGPIEYSLSLSLIISDLFIIAVCACEILRMSKSLTIL